MNVREDTTRGNGNTAKQLVELLIVTDGELNVTRDDTGLLVITSGVSGELENLSGKVLHHSGHVDWGTGTDTVGVTALAKETMNTTNWELEASLAGTGLRGLLRSHC